MNLSKPDIIRLAACHTCAARPGQPCLFARKDDPQGLRMAAHQSHIDRIERARAKVAPNKEREARLKLALDDLRL